MFSKRYHYYTMMAVNVAALMLCAFNPVIPVTIRGMLVFINAAAFTLNLVTVIESCWCPICHQKISRKEAAYCPKCGVALSDESSPESSEVY